MKREQKQTNAETQSFIIHESTIRMSSLLSDEELGRLIRYFYMYLHNLHPQKTQEQGIQKTGSKENI